MTDIRRVQNVWSGFVGGPGYTNFYLLDGGIDVVAKIKQFFETFKTGLPNDVTITTPAQGETFNAETGELVGTWALTGGGNTQGEGGANYSAPVGGVVNWKTGSINRGHKVRGRSFMVPLAGANFGPSGALLAVAQNALQADATALVDSLAGNLVVWSRPRLKVGGLAAPVTSASVPSLAAVLRSRRD